MNNVASSPLVTIVIPAYNHEQYVEEAIKSVISQHYKSWELIIIDDGSTDKTGIICDKFAGHENIQVIHQENIGLSNTLNKALELAKGSYFGFLPSDDKFYPEKLLIQVDFLESHNELAGVGSLQTLIDEKGEPIHDKAMEEWFSYIPSSRTDFLLKLLERNFVPAPSMLLRTDVVRDVGGFDPDCRYMQDYDLWFRILKHHDMRILPRPLIYYRWHGENLTFRATDETENERGRVFEKAAKLLDITDLYPELWEEFRPEVIALCRVDLHERLSKNPTPNFEEIHGIFDEKFTSLWRKRKVIDLPPKAVEYIAPSYLTDTPPPTIILEVSSLDKGGLEQVVHDLAIGLTTQGTKVVVVCIREGGLIAQKLKEKGIRVEVLPLNNKEEAYREIITGTKARLINSHYSHFGAKLAFEMAIPFVSTIHNIYAWLPPFAEEGMREVDPLTCHYVAVSNDVKEFVIDRFGIEPRKISVIPNGLDITKWEEKEKNIGITRRELGLEDNDFVFLTTAAISRVKGQDRIVRAMAHVSKVCPNARAVFVGPDVDKAFDAYLHELVQELGLEKHVFFRPFQQNPEDWYFNADAFVLPSIIEGWSISMLEALYVGLPIIMTNIAGAKTVLSESDAGIPLPTPFNNLWQLDTDFLEKFSMNPNDPLIHHLTDAMIDVCTNKDIWKERGKAGRKLVLEKYTLKQQTESYEKLFNKIIMDFSIRFVSQFNTRNHMLQKALDMTQRTIEKVYEGQRQGYWLHTLGQQLQEAWQKMSQDRQKLENEIQELRNELMQIYNSKGWKVIETARKVKKTIKK